MKERNVLFNIDLLQYDTHEKTNNFVDGVQKFFDTNS